MKQVLFTLMMLVGCSAAQAQVANPFMKDFQDFRQKAKSDYEKFRDEANRRYADLLRGEWHPYEPEEPLIKPKENELPPVIFDEKEAEKPIESKPIEIEGEPITLPEVKPQPEPLAPIAPMPIVAVTPVPDNPNIPVVPVPVPVTPVQEETPRVQFTYFGTPMEVRFSPDQQIKMEACTPEAIATGWERMIGKDYDNTLYDCLELRKKHQMGDWAYLLLLDSVAHACTAGNEATLMLSYLYQQSGYKVRMGISNQELVMLFATDHVLYDRTSFTMDGSKFFVYGTDDKIVDMRICDASFPKEQELSLWMQKPLLLANHPTNRRRISSEKYKDMSVEVSVNSNLLAFYNHYPSSRAKTGSFMTRWAMLATTPFATDDNKETLAELREKLADLSEKEAVERLLNCIQTGLEYEFDEKVWGADRAFFPSESLFYPYCDCEDRSILLSRLVGDLLGLKSTLIYYPGHLAMAIHFNEPVKGDYVEYNGERFVVCDPTYIGAPIGMTMPDMDNAAAKLIVVQ